MAKTIPSITLTSTDEDEVCIKKPIRLAPIFLPQKRLSAASETRCVRKKKKKPSPTKEVKVDQKKEDSPEPNFTQKLERHADVLLSSDEDTIIDPFEADTDTEPMSPIVYQETGASREEETANNIWAEKNRPKNCEQLVGNSDKVKTLKSFVKNFARNRVLHDQYEIDEDELANLQMGTDETTEALFAIITGKCGVGKTSLVYAVAGDLGMKVFELNASSLRTGKILIESLQEATKSHHLRRQHIPAATSSNSIANFFNKTPAPTEDNSSSNSQISSNTIILLDDVDLIVDEEELDDSFWRSLKTFIQESKVPVILTATSLVADILDQQLGEMEGLVLHLLDPPLQQLTKHLLTVFSQESDDAIDVDAPHNQLLVQKLILDLGFDVRKSLNHLQFLGPSFFKQSKEVEIPTSHLDGNCKEVLRLENSSIYEMWKFVNNEESNLQSTIGIFEDQCYLRDHRFTSNIRHTSLTAKMESEKWSREYDHLCDVLSAVCTDDVYFPQSEIRLDVMPYISTICLTEASKADVEAPELFRTRRQSRRRTLHYFDSIGFPFDPSDRAMCGSIFQNFADAESVEESVDDVWLSQRDPRPSRTENPMSNSDDSNADLH